MAPIANAATVQIQARKAQGAFFQKQSPFPPRKRALTPYCGQTTDKSVQRWDNVPAWPLKTKKRVSEKLEPKPFVARFLLKINGNPVVRMGCSET
jgi:hypothetical protein